MIDPAEIARLQRGLSGLRKLGQVAAVLKLNEYGSLLDAAERCARLEALLREALPWVRLATRPGTRSRELYDWIAKEIGK